MGPFKGENAKGEGDASAVTTEGGDFSPRSIFTIQHCWAEDGCDVDRCFVRNLADCTHGELFSDNSVHSGSAYLAQWFPDLRG